MEANKNDLEKIKYIHDNYPSLHKAITGAKMNIFGTKNAQNDLVKLLNIKSQLKADKEELLEALEIFIEQNTPTFTSHDYEFPEHVMKAKSLIQKHKQ